MFGANPQSALAMMDEGRSREEIKEATSQVLGVHDCSLSVAPGEIVVLMGLSGSGKSTLLRAVNGLNPVTRGALRVAMSSEPGGEMLDVARCDAQSLRRFTDITVIRRQRVGNQLGIVLLQSARRSRSRG